MHTFIEKLKSLFHHRPRIIAALVVILALSLPFVINQVLKQQDLRQRASAAPSITFNFSPASQNMTVGGTINVDLVMNAGTNDVGALHFKLKYDPTILEVTELSQSTSLQSIQKTNSQGVFEAVMINPTITPATGNSLKVFTFQFKALKTGTATIAIDPDTLQATSQLADGTYVPVDGKTNIVGSYVITTSNSTEDTSFDFNNGLNHCRPSIEGCETTLGESLLNNGDCSTYLGTTAHTCSAVQGYNTNGTSIIDPSCPTIASDNHIQYCIPTNRTVPSGWIEIPNGNNICTTYNTVPSKCYKSTFTTAQISTTITTSPSLTISPDVTRDPTASPTQIPTTTVSPGETGLKLSLKLPGIGKVSGDNILPVRIRRTATVSVYDSANTEVVHEKTGALEYNAANGRYEGSVGIGATIATGSYTVKVRMDNTLIKRLPGIVAITSGKSDNTTPEAELVTGDLDQDNALGVQDYTNFLGCFHGAAACTGNTAIFADMNDNGSTDGDNDDMNILQYNYVNRQGD